MALPSQVLLMAEHAAATISRRDLVAAGFPPDAIDRWVGAGLLVNTVRGEFRIPGSEQSLRQELATMLWRAGPGARIGGALRCALAGLDGFRLSAHRDHIVVPPGRRVRGVAFKVVRTPVAEEDQERVMDLPAVTLARGLIGACADYRPARIRVAYDQARFKGLLREAEFADRALSLGNAYGAPQARKLVRSGALSMESEPERDLFSIFRPADPRPEPQVWVQVRGRWHRLDFAYRDVRVALEYDGDGHAFTREADADRDLALLELRVVTIRITKAMLRDAAATRRRILAVVAGRRGRDIPPLPRISPPWVGARTVSPLSGG